MYRKGFTLLELLIVIAILAVLATVAVLVINPLEYIKQSRDTKRISDMDVLNKALPLYDLNNPGVIAAQPSTTIYISLPDTSSTCGSYALPTLPPGYVYNCVSQANLIRVDNAGWIPVAFSAIPGGAPFASLPIDPINDATHYYEYIPGGSWVVSASIESNKYLKQSAVSDGGANPARYEVGSNLSLAYKGEGLVGYWPFDEGGGTVANDTSGNGNNGTWNGTGVHYAAGKVGPYAASFNGSTDYIDVGSIKPSEITIAVWLDQSASQAAVCNLVSRGNLNNGSGYFLEAAPTGISFNASYGGGGYQYDAIGAINPGINKWGYVVATASSAGIKLYINGVLNGTAARTSVLSYGAGDTDTMIGSSLSYEPLLVNASWQPCAGLMDDVRIYNRALSGSEIQAMYNAEK